MAGSFSPSGDRRTIDAVTGTQTTLLDAATTVGPGPWVKRSRVRSAVQATVTGTGTVTATVAIEVSLDGVNAVDTDPFTITLSGTATDTDGDVLDAPWLWVRANLTAISGTAAAVTTLMGD